jgi:hypothetical protein
MKPELVIQDFGGVHNKDHSKTAARLMKGGSWKKQRIIVIIPSAANIPAKVVLSWLNLGFPPNNGVVRILALGMEVGDAYSTAIENILANAELSQWEYILTIEHDNAPASDGVIRLVEVLETHPELNAVGGLYFTKGEGGCAQIWGDPKDPIINYRPQLPIPEGLVECCGLGMGFTMFRLKMFKDDRLRKPWFKTLSGSGGFATQDLYFWGDARKYGYRCAVDCGTKVGHYDSAQDIMW